MVQIEVFAIKVVVQGLLPDGACSATAQCLGNRAGGSLTESRHLNGVNFRNSLKTRAKARTR